MDKRIEERLARYRKVLERIMPPSQVDAQVKVFVDMAATIPAETILMSLDASIEQLPRTTQQVPARDVRALQIVYACAAPTLEWWQDRGRRGVDPETDTRFLADCATDLIRADADREFAARQVLIGRLLADRSLAYGDPGRLGDGEVLSRLPEPDGPDQPVPVALLPGGAGLIEALFPARGHPFQDAPAGFRVRLTDGETWSLETKEGVLALFACFPLDITARSLGTLLHWMLAPLPWGTRIVGVGDELLDGKEPVPEWFREWARQETAHRHGEREIDPATLELFGAAPHEGGRRRIPQLTLKLRLPDDSLAIAVYRPRPGQDPEYGFLPVREGTARYVQLVVGNLLPSMIKEVPALPEGLLRPDCVLRLDLHAWPDFFHLNRMLFVSRRVYTLLARGGIADLEVIPAVVEHAGYDAGGERRPYFGVHRVRNFPTENALRRAIGGAGYLPFLCQVEGIDPELEPTLFRTGLLVLDVLYDRFRDGGFTGMQCDPTGLEIPAYFTVEGHTHDDPKPDGPARTEASDMEELKVPETPKRYKFFQFSGFCDGHLAGQVTLNGAVMHELTGEPGSVATAAAQEALKYGRNVIRVEVTGVNKPEDPTFKYSILAVDGTEEGFDSDTVVEFQGDLSGVTAFPWVKEYGFTLDGDSFAVLKGRSGSQ